MTGVQTCALPIFSVDKDLEKNRVLTNDRDERYNESKEAENNIDRNLGGIDNGLLRSTGEESKHTGRDGNLEDIRGTFESGRDNREDGGDSREETLIHSLMMYRFTWMVSL